jgi:EAL domain-containing protein (putative c-di-GMP-specific phosphodiesterase class I)
MAQASAKRMMGDVFRVFLPEMEALRREKQVIDTELRHAIADGSLELKYQPKVDLATGRLTGAEALMRWRNPNGEPVSPAKFIPIAEESGLIVELGRWALRRACNDAKIWPEASVVAVNVSPIQFALTDVFEEVRLALAESGLPPRRLEIEITESIFVERESEISATLEKLRAIGVTVALDDFGTGYSSLHYLGRLPIDTIKIDQSFIRRLLLDAQAAATVQAIVSLAKAHGKHLVAEGIEEVEQARVLNGLGCEVGQGFYFGRAQEPAEFREALDGEGKVLAA